MHSKLSIVAVALVACFAISSVAGQPDSVEQCATQVAKKLENLVIPGPVAAHASSVIKFMDKHVDAEGNVVEGASSEEDAQVAAGDELAELDRYSCVEHLEKFYFATSGFGCHRQHWARPDWRQYDNALFATNEQARRAVVGARMCINFLDAYVKDPSNSEVDRTVVSQALVRVM